MGAVSEWSKERDWKSRTRPKRRVVGSNPTRSASEERRKRRLEQGIERMLKGVKGRKPQR
jgi:hypothetical protein